jgi:hypothetical protein
MGHLGHFDPVIRRASRDRARESEQAIIEDGFRADLGSLLLAERFVRAATGLACRP